ncbi:Methylthioribose-1-phosphate isomerase [Beijerinckiaceae bacterium RH AL1]|nr:S-methyl-5-thioribose-1-phosphate isomerase [Beijerinckiaceae bacterium]VVB43975.1 Methylthioribose-1-phosphate isomerase [Beijerinckiaceae bacterium RH CH11]VVB44002.1 Methylthioribose-1-phosphate isomerase [Beijerinckiaceae bacterium RH AL8]VVC54108.1 Methylthioribose-1-phosphate isomerase [Beijerinckiaceae bacterium RH AL1]
MKVDGESRRTIWALPSGDVQIIDQVALPHRFTIATLATMPDAARAIRDMHVRGAPLIGVAAAYGVALAMRADPSDASLYEACETLRATRPTAVNLAWALAKMQAVLEPLPPPARAEAAYAEAAAMAEADVEMCRAMAEHGLAIIKDLAAAHPGRPVEVLTHCNAGWLAAVDWGTATAPIYAAHEAGIDVHVFVDETRPRNQGASLTAWELGRHGVPHTVVVDNVGGHLMQHGKVDCVIVGTDRTTATGDVCNKIGTYLKALAAKANDVPFYVAAPSSSIDFAVDDGVAGIPIEERGAEEVTHMTGLTDAGDVARIRLVPEGSAVMNFAFDVTPATLVTGLITERGVIPATREALARTFPERVVQAAVGVET